MKRDEALLPIQALLSQFSLGRRWRADADARRPGARFMDVPNGAYLDRWCATGGIGHPLCAVDLATALEPFDVVGLCAIIPLFQASRGSIARLAVMAGWVPAMTRNAVRRSPGEAR